MLRTNRWILVVPVAAALQLAACHTSASKPAKTKPAHVEHVEGSELSRVTLTAKAAERLDIKTAQVREARVERSGTVRQAGTGSATALRKVVPYAAVLYDAHGATWVYTSPEPLVFIRHRITVDYIDGDQAVLSEGPPAGTAVVTMGGAELFGAEFEIGH